MSTYLTAPTLAPMTSAGPETRHSSAIRRKRSFDDLLLPSLPLEPAQYCYHDSTYLAGNPSFEARADHKRARTAPASPVGVFTNLTPKASPLSAKATINCAPLAAPPSKFSAGDNSASQSQQVSNSQRYGPSTSASISKESFYTSSLSLASITHRNNEDSESDENPNITQTNNCAPLPSLKHLQLLPNPKIQENAYRYPDTSEKTPLWRESLVSWCKSEKYNDYLQINKELHEVSSYPATGLNILASVAFMSQKIPSLLNARDEFSGLSNCASLHGVVTPPMSPRSANSTTRSSPVFTPAISDKLVQTVKEKRTKAHKKTNSFKAREMKKLLNDRDILSLDSKGKVSKVRQSRARSAPSSPQQFVIKLDALTSPKSITKSSPKEVSGGQKILGTDSSPPRSRTPPRTHVFMLNEPRTPNTSSSLNSVHADSATTYSSSSDTPVVANRKLSSPKRSAVRTCISCHATDSPCWRPSWTNRKQDQLCNSCGLRYKKTQTRCLNDSCRKIPSKGELAIMKANGSLTRISPDGSITRGLGCLFCNSIVEIKE
ncbi:LAFA_0G11518g1_1 [Lachancea sp. 'fantastica']|nr:LAFA_0G11518g1_1 [Lachancea sp. 'fantastica']